MKNLKIRFTYELDEKINKLVVSENYSCKDFAICINKSDLTLGEKLNVKILPNRDIKVKDFSISYKMNFTNKSKVFVNGYESWTDSREFSVDEKLTNISKMVPKTILKKYGLYQYGDYNFKKYSDKKGVFHGFTYGYVRNGEIFNLVGSLSEKSGFTILNYDINQNKVVIEKECKELIIKKDYTVFDLVFLIGKENDVFDKYFGEMKIDKPKVKPMTGYTSWYHHYQNISEDILLENLESISSLNKDIDIFQIDDGYQTAVGDWLSIDKNKFPNGMKIIADKTKEKGMIPGIWLAPFACEINSEITRQHPDWILKNNDGSFVTGGSNWGGFYALDFCNVEVQKYLEKVFNEIINVWGFEMVKLDFLYATCIVPREGKTRGQIMCEAMDFLRKCVGNKLILGCGVPLGAAFGKVDFCRIGCDIGLDWNDKWYMRFLHRERVSTQNALINTIGRRHLDGRAFLNDPDVFLLRDENIMLTDEQKQTLALLNHLFGSLLFTSDDVKKYTEDQMRVFNKTIEKSEIEILSVEQNSNLITSIDYKENGVEYTAKVNLKTGSSRVIKRS